MTSDAVSLADSALGRLSVGALRGVKRARLMGVVASVVASVAAVTVDGVATAVGADDVVASRYATSTASMVSLDSPINIRKLAATVRLGKIPSDRRSPAWCSIISKRGAVLVAPSFTGATTGPPRSRIVRA